MLFEQVMKWQGFPLAAAKQKIVELSGLTPTALYTWQEAQRNDIVRFHLAHNPFYQSIAPANFANWEELPVLTKKSFQAPLPELLSDAFGSVKDVYVGNTSGSSGHPFFYAKDKYAHALTWAHVAALYAQHGITLRSRQARFYGIPFDKIGFWKETLKDRIAKRRRFPVFDLSEPVLAKWVKRFQQEAFDYLYGYTSSLVYFARYCTENGIVLKNICPSLKVCMVTSEACTPEDRIVLEKGFGVPVVNEYGASELGIIAFENPAGEWLLSDELIYLEIVDEAGKHVPEGTPGRVLCTSLFNKAMPIIRYEIGDVGVIEMKNGRRVLTQLLGRTNDFVQLPSGRVSPGLTFYYISRSILEKAGFINEFIIKQTALDTLVFVIDAKRKLSAAEIEIIEENIVTYLEPGMKLEIEEVDQIERPASGKIKHFYSYLNLQKQDKLQS